MAQQTVLPSLKSAVAGVIDPDATAAGTVTTGWISMATFNELMAVVQVGTLGTNATVDAKLEQATDNSGAGAKDITGKAITQMTQAGTDESDRQAVINLNAEELDVNNDFSHARLSVTVATATSDIGALVLGLGERYGPASDNDLASVAEIVA
ncbi:MAG: hypothetical protein ACPG4X_18690 [Pikeienuella sp.]